jgi:hypothetical protein
VFNFGIAGYQPQWLQGRDTITAAHGRRLADLTGLTLRHLWLVWDMQADEWFTDCPVLLDFGDQRVAVNHQKFDELAVTFDTIDPNQPVVWPTSDGFQLAWRPEPLIQLAALTGQQLHHVDLLEWAGGDLADGTVAIGFTFPARHLMIYNALDENGLDYEIPTSDWRRYRLA